MSAWRHGSQRGPPPPRHMGLMTLQQEAERLRAELEKLDQVRVRVALFGQPGAGKSSLINALVGREVAVTGERTDTTVDAHSYHHDGVVYTDLPGFGTTRFPADTYWERFKLDEQDLLLCVKDSKFSDADDRMFFEQLWTRGKVCLFVHNKSDTLWSNTKTTEEIRAELSRDLEERLAPRTARLVFASCRTKEGLDELERAIGDYLPDAKRERWERAAAAYSEEWLQRKRAIIQREVYIGAALSAINGFNPIPGADLAIDLSALAGLLVRIRNHYGLSDARLERYLQFAPAAKALTDKVLKYATREGLLLLLKRFASRQLEKQVTKYIPFIGQAVAASVGYGITLQVGFEFLDTCHELALQVMKAELNHHAP
jgi:GTP-binding protein EngB required for normal cell division